MVPPPPPLCPYAVLLECCVGAGVGTEWWLSVYCRPFFFLGDGIESRLGLDVSTYVYYRSLYGD